ncbi:MAG: DUF1501 domain-containing protein [Acidobacteria bacterium]|nr:DUF1501 domain-containing protein [Acidobacteriota bacterium]
MKTCPSCLKMSRRKWLTAAGLLGITRRGDAQITSMPVETRNSAKACIFINLDGAPSHVDTFDPKDGPWNPNDADIQQHGKIAISQRYFPVLAKHTDRMCVLRSVASWEAEHVRGQFYLQTSHPSNPAFAAETPHIGAVAALERGGEGKIPPFLALNGTAGQGASFLGGKYEPMATPANVGGLSTITHNYYGAQSQQRFEEKFKLLEELEAPFRAAPFDPVMAAQPDYYAAAKGLMYDPVVTQFFQFSNEERLRYGSSNFGNACIVARNAIRAKSGAAFITIRNGGWDTHQSMFDTAYPQNFYNLVNTLDSGVGNLVEDLRASGDLDQTLIVIMGEFGRTPGELNSRGGRDHHRIAMSAVMIGGGVKGGAVIGATDAIGGRIIDPGWHAQRPIYPEDITTTIYSALGINWTKRILDTPSGRIYEYVAGSIRGEFEPVTEVFA